MDWTAFALSLQLAGWTVVLLLPLAVVIARALAWGRVPGKSAIEALIMLPLVLPPTVVGYMILLTFGARGWPGAWLFERFGYSIAFKFEGAVLAALVVAMPMLYMPAKAAFQSVDRELEDVARMMGANRLQLFWHVSLPLARRGILSGMMLAFARALGEFGATAMVFGMQDKHFTLPISIYLDWERGEFSHALPAVVALTLTSLAIMLAYNRWTRVTK